MFEMFQGFGRNALIISKVTGIACWEPIAAFRRDGISLILPDVLNARLTIGLSQKLQSTARAPKKN
jgi:hypothetical protein